MGGENKILGNGAFALTLQYTEVEGDFIVFLRSMRHFPSEEKKLF